MSSAGKRASLAVIVLCAAVAGSSAVLARVIVRHRADISQAKTERARIVFSHALPQLDGGHLKATIVEVNYGPGESSEPHSHPCAVVGYVVEGTLRTQVKGEAEAIYKAGESFYEAPNGIHMVSANASDEVPLKLLAYFVCDHEAPLSSAALETKGTGGK
ncbi:MAG: cupin domain-containing protein [Candidatus Acidiferrum sp.]